MAITAQVSCAINDGIPIHEAGHARVADGASQLVVALFVVRDDVAADALVVNLPQR